MYKWVDSVIHSQQREVYLFSITKNRVDQNKDASIVFPVFTF